jgi:hypothetical protein
MFRGVISVKLRVCIPNAQLWGKEVCHDSVVTEVTETIGVALKHLIKVRDRSKNWRLNRNDVVKTYNFLFQALLLSPNI